MVQGGKGGGQSLRNACRVGTDNATDQRQGRRGTRFVGEREDGRHGLEKGVRIEGARLLDRRQGLDAMPITVDWLLPKSCRNVDSRRAISSGVNSRKSKNRKRLVRMGGGKSRPSAASVSSIRRPRSIRPSRAAT